MKGELVTFKTSDGIKLSGFLKKSDNKGKKCVIFIHGLTGQFLGYELVNVLGEKITNTGYNFFTFNNRGSGVITDFRKNGKSITIGGGVERFEDCVKDIKAAINFLKGRGFTEIFLIGHSTGCQKSVYYQSRTHDKRVKGLILLGPASDVSYEKKRLGNKFKKEVIRARKLIESGKKHQLMKWGTLTAYRYYNLYKQNSIEGNIFNYETGRMPLLSKVNVPVVAMYGSRDKYSVYGPERELSLIGKNIKSESYSSVMVSGAKHGFEDHEDKVSSAIIKWLKTIA